MYIQTNNFIPYKERLGICNILFLTITRINITIQYVYLLLKCIILILILIFTTFR